MKKVKYKMHETVNRGTPEVPVWEEILIDKEIPHTEENEELARKEAFMGQYTVYDDGETASPSRLDILEAQSAYTAMMTNTHLEV